MKTAFQNGPGFYAAATSDKRRDLPRNTMRIYCARLEAYDLPLTDDAMDAVKWELLPAQAEGKPEIARALLLLADVLAANKAELERQAKG